MILGDEASWVWDRVADLAEAGQRVWHILDFWHACDHLVKYVVAARMKQSGMMWSLDGAKDMLQLRASVKSRRFGSDFERLLPAAPAEQNEETHLRAA